MITKLKDSAEQAIETCDTQQEFHELKVGLGL